MPGRGWFEAFVSGWLFWSYFVSWGIKRRDMTLARSLDIGAGALEEIYELAVDELYQSIPEVDRKELKSHTSQKNNNANVHQVNTLFFYLGIPWVMSHQKLRWKKCSNSKVQEKLRNLSKARNQLAHGGSRIVRKQTLVAWRDFSERLANKLDEITADHIEEKLGNRPW